MHGIAWISVELLQVYHALLALYLNDLRTLVGSVIPGLISLGLFLKYAHQIKDPQTILGFLLFAVTLDLCTQYWGANGLNLMISGFVIWPVLVLLLGDRLPWPMAYPLAFVGTLIPDLYGAGMASHWTGRWFFGIGDAGFQDALFLVPLETLIAAAVLNPFGTFMRKRGYFSRRASVDEDVYPEGRDRRAR